MKNRKNNLLPNVQGTILSKISLRNYTLLIGILTAVIFSIKSREEAEKIIEIVRHYNAKYTCYAPRPNPGFIYLRK